MKINFDEPADSWRHNVAQNSALVGKAWHGHGIFHAFNSTFVDATLTQTSSSIKNEKKQRDPEMCQTKKSNQYYFHIGVNVGDLGIKKREEIISNKHLPSIEYQINRWAGGV